MEVMLPMKGRRDPWKEQETRKWDDVYRNVRCELGGGRGSIAVYFKLFVCVCFYIRLFNTGKILL